MILFVSVLILMAILSTKFSNRFGLPLLIGFILIGIIVGSDVLNLFNFDDALLTRKIADIILIFIIYEGGFRITKSEFKSVAGPSLSLATIGVALTAGILGLLIHFVLKIDLIFSLLIASTISSTDAAAVFMITKSRPIKNKLSTTLSVESAANDPMAIVLTVTFIQIAEKLFSSPLMAVISLIWQFVGGFIVGIVCYKISIFLFNKLQSDKKGDYNVLLIGCVLFTYGLSSLISANGIIAVFFLGYKMGNAQFPSKRSAGSFLESLSTIFNMILFILLGLLASPSRFVNVWKPALVIVGFMMFVARPLAVFLTLIPFKYTFREKIFLMWGGIKGAVPIVLATYPIASGLDNSDFIFDTIFFAVCLSCLIQGTTLGPLAKLMKFTKKRKKDSLYSVELHSLVNTDLDMIQVELTQNSVYVNRIISDLSLERDVLISAIVRNNKLILPRGNTVLLADDILYVMCPICKIDEVTQFFNAKAQLPPPPDMQL